MLLTNEPSAPFDAQTRYLITPDGGFHVRDYDQAPCFWSFLPAIAGLRGAPLWVMYANRGQAVVSFGAGDKNHAIAEFMTASHAPWMTGICGFRTFLIQEDGEVHEPFASESLKRRSPVHRTMEVERHQVSIAESHPSSGIQTRVLYTSLSGSPVPCLLRRVSMTNTGPLEFRCLMADGLPAIVPAGFNDFAVKHVRRTMEAFARVELPQPGVARYFTPVSTSDDAEVRPQEASSFFVALCNGEKLPLVVDPDRIFGEDREYDFPRQLADWDTDPFSGQCLFNRIPCGFAVRRLTLAPGETCHLDVFVGHAPNARMLSDFLLRLDDKQWIAGIADETRDCIDEVTAPARTLSALPEIDGYVRQNFLDNVLRGGVPLRLPSREGGRLVHTYCRRHGDMERDYNNFVVPPHPLSEGSGNFRDVLQNRRSDCWIWPEHGADEIYAFASYLQPDGYNPLSLEGWRWQLGEDPAAFVDQVSGEALGELRHLVASPFAPGELASWADRHAVAWDLESGWFPRLLSQCHTTLEATDSGEGYWIDHWTYLTDMLEAWTALFPDRLHELLHEPDTCSWFHPTNLQPDPETTIARRPDGSFLQSFQLQDAGGESARFPAVTLAGKLLSLTALKLVTLDPEGRGIEMEAGRPGWNDALNGLPGLGGSSTCETAELLRLARWLQNSLHRDTAIAVPAPLAELIDRASLMGGEEPWDYPAALQARTSYRSALRVTGTHHLAECDVATIGRMIEAIISRCEKGVEMSLRNDGLPDGYYWRRYDTSSESAEKSDGEPAALPLFLEPVVHFLRVYPERAREVYAAVRESRLYDEQLRMYRVNEPLDGVPREIGRLATFLPGILENESIWLHMSYKYLLELLRAGLHEEFFADISTMLVPFMDPSVYCRSPLENSSYIVSSNCPDRNIVGRGFVARLSGSTAEFLSIWNEMVLGPRPFVLRGGVLAFDPRPVLPAAWFRPIPETNGKATALFTTTILEKTTLHYSQNGEPRNTWGEKPVSPKLVSLDNGEWMPIDQLCGSLAQDLREKKFQTVEIKLG